MTKAQFIRDAADEIKRQRAALGISRAEIATAIGVSEPAVMFWEQGRSVMSAYSAMLLRLYFKRKWHEREQEVIREVARAEEAL